MAITCLDHPPAGQPARQPRAPTEKEQACYAQVLQHFQSLKDLPVSQEAAASSSSTSSERSPLTEREKFWLSEEQLYRFVRATKCDAKSAISRLEQTLLWRRTHKIDELSAEYIEPEQQTGKQIIYGFDHDGRPLCYTFPSRKNTEASWRQVEHVFYMLWLSEMLMPRGVETVALMINFSDKAASPSLSTAKQVLFSLQDHYPERLGKARVINVPWLLKGFFKIITPFIDPVTREKLSFDQDCSGAVEASILATPFGGQADLSQAAYDHQAYWTGPKGVATLARERERRMLDKFRQLGGTVGLKEWDMKEGEQTWTWPQAAVEQQ